MQAMTPGSTIQEGKANVCKGCKANVLLGLVRDGAGTLKWRNFQLPAIERGPHRFYRPHYCPARQAQPTTPPPDHDRRLLDR